MDREHVLLCVMGRTACGKDSLVNKLCERTGLKRIISYTTRERRVGEGETYHFSTKEDYEEIQSTGRMAAYTEIAGNYYWTTVDQLYDSDVYIIDPMGVKTLRALNLPNLKIVTVFIHTPDAIREERALTKRKDNKIIYRKRNLDESAQFREMLRNADFDYAISNIELPKAYSILRHISDIEGVWKNHLEEEA